MAEDADTILESYLGGKLPKAAKVAEPTATTADDYLAHYLDTTPAVKTDAKRVVIDTTPKPPISGATAEQSAEINSQPSQPGGENPRRYSSPSKLAGDVAAGLSEVPGDVLQGTAERAREGIDAVKSGAADIAQNRPASGVGKAGLGVLQYATAPIGSAIDNLVVKPVTKATGNSDFGTKAGDVVGGLLPVGKANDVRVAAKPENRAFKDFVAAIGEKNIPAVIKELKSNPRLAPMDVAPELLQATQKLAVTPGPHQGLLHNVVEQRLNSAKGAIANTYDSTMGAPVNVLNKLDSMKEAARKVGRSEISPAVIGSKPVDVTTVIKHIDEVTKPGVNSVITSGSPLPTTELKQQLIEVRKLLTDGKSMRTDADTLHAFQSALRKEADTLLSSPDGASKRTGHALMEVRNKIVDAIDAASPQVEGKGTYKASLGRYADEMQIDNAFDKGTEILRNRSTKYDDRPEFWEKWVKNAKPAELEAAREGARIAVDNQIRGMRNAIGQKGTEIPQVDFNKEKLSLLFGKKEIEEMATKLEHERKIADTNNKLFQNSQTAMRMKADSRVAERTDKGLEGSSVLPYLAEGIAAYSTGYPGIGAASYKAADFLKRHIANPVINKRADAKNYELSRLASATGPEREELIKRLSDLVTPPKPSMLSKAKLALPVRNP